MTYRLLLAYAFVRPESEQNSSQPRMPGRNFLFVPGPTNAPDRVMRAMMVAMEDHRFSKVLN
jgi:hypothetical protein